MQLSYGKHTDYQMLWLKHTLRLSRVSNRRSDISITLAGTTWESKQETTQGTALFRGRVRVYVCVRV